MFVQGSVGGGGLRCSLCGFFGEIQVRAGFFFFFYDILPSTDLSNFSVFLL